MKYGLLGSSCRVAGLARVEFLTKLEEYGVSPFQSRFLIFCEPFRTVWFVPAPLSWMLNAQQSLARVVFSVETHRNEQEKTRVRSRSRSEDACCEVWSLG